MLPKLDPLLHSQLRLQIVTLLAQVESADFNYLLEQTKASRGNISVQLNKLKDADYVQVTKSFGKSYPVTTCQLTEQGREAFAKYVDDMMAYLGPSKN